MRKICSIAASLIFCLQLSAKAAEQVRSVADLKGATYVLFTNPQECPACRGLEEDLKKHGETTAINVSQGGVSVSLPIQRYDPWVGDTDKINQLKQIGYQEKGIPQFAVVKNGKILGIGVGAYQSGPLAITRRDRDSFLCRQGETFEQCLKRVKAMLSSDTDYGHNLLIAVGLIRSSVEEASDFDPTKKVGKRNILIAGTAATPFDNPIFTPVTIEKVLASLAEASSVTPTILYGGGNTDLCDTCETLPGAKAPSMMHFEDLKPDSSFTEAAFAKYFSAVASVKPDTNLIILIGHGDKDGAITWLRTEALPPQKFGRIVAQSTAPTVLVSGNCYGGQMAQQVTCGFMGAPPNRTASGCYEDLQQSKNAKDYVSEFFKAIGSDEVDFNHDGKITFAEAHARAVLHSNGYDHPYTTWDDLAKSYITQNPPPLLMETNEFESSYLNLYGSATDKALYHGLLKQLPGVHAIPLSTSTVRLTAKDISFSVSHDPDGDDSTSYVVSNTTPLAGSKFQVKDASLIVERAGPNQYVVYDAQKKQNVELGKLTVKEPVTLSASMDNLRSLVLRLVYKKAVSTSADPQIKAQKAKLLNVIRCENRPITDFI